MRTHSRFSPFFPETKTAPCMVNQIKEARLYTDSIIVDLSGDEGRVLVSDSVLKNPGTHCLVKLWSEMRTKTSMHSKAI
jgi:hypothetical protein